LGFTGSTNYETLKKMCCLLKNLEVFYSVPYIKLLYDEFLANAEKSTVNAFSLMLNRYAVWHDWWSTSGSGVPDQSGPDYC
jgi:hypothetical protein